MKKSLKIQVTKDDSVSAILQLPEKAFCLMVLAHGAGAGMEHRFMQDLADRLETTGIGTLRFNFLYMEKQGGRPDVPQVAQNVIRSVVSRAISIASPEGIPVIGAGKSFGGRMFSHVMAAEGTPDVAALVFYGFPLHAPGRDGVERAAHLKDVKVPMLFLQGTRDTLARVDLITDVAKGLKKGTISILDEGDHSFKVPKRTGKSESDVMDWLVSETEKWLHKKLK